MLLSEHVETLTPASIRSFISDCRTCSSDNLLMIPGIEIDALNALFYGVQAVDSWQQITPTWPVNWQPAALWLRFPTR